MAEIPGIAELFKQGILGIICAILFIWIFLKDRQQNARDNNHRDELKALNKTHGEEVQELRQELADEQKLRVEDAKAQTELALKLQSEVTSSVSAIGAASKEQAKLGKLVDKLLGAVQRFLDRDPSPRRPH